MLRRPQARVAEKLRAAANAVLIAAAKCLWLRSRPHQAARVCIYRIGNVGDTMCAVPAMRAIRRAYPAAHLTLVTSPGNTGSVGARELLEGASWLDSIVVYHAEGIASPAGRWKLIGEMRARNFDVWIELPVVAATFATLLRNMFVARLAGARWGFGWRYDRLRLFAQAQSEHLAFPNEVERLLEVLLAAGITSSPRDLEFELNDSDRRGVSDLFERMQLGACEIISFAPGAKADPNRWPASHFIEVGRSLAARKLAIIVLGGDGDAALCERVANSIGPSAINLAGKTTLRASCEVLARSLMLVCNDSGVQHLAAAVGTPCVSLFSRRDFPGKWWPYGARHEVLWSRVPCHTCFLDHCPRDNECIKLISVGEVIAAIDRVLARLSNARKFETSAPEPNVA
jgi:ADP-heptose:LPS heptosyltransferase